MAAAPILPIAAIFTISRSVSSVIRVFIAHNRNPHSCGTNVHRKLNIAQGSSLNHQRRTRWFRLFYGWSPLLTLWISGDTVLLHNSARTPQPRETPCSRSTNPLLGCSTPGLYRCYPFWSEQISSHSTERVHLDTRGLFSHKLSIHPTRRRTRKWGTLRLFDLKVRQSITPKKVSCTVLKGWVFHFTCSAFQTERGATLI